MSERKQFLVKDADGEYQLITADGWECGGNGLKFKRELEGGPSTVAWFATWQHFQELNPEQG